MSLFTGKGLNFRLEESLEKGSAEALFALGSEAPVLMGWWAASSELLFRCRRV